jgi:hypothetical protein
MDRVRKSVVLALVLALGMIVSAALLSRLFVRVKQVHGITVKGYAEKRVVSDLGTFRCSFSARRPGMKQAYEELERARAAVLAYLTEQGFEPGEIDVLTIDTTELYRRDEEGRKTNEVEFYRVGQSVRVTSGNVELIRIASQKITELIRDGLDIYSGSPSFYVSDLDEIKKDLLARATRNGYERARILAGGGRGRVGSLTRAVQGVFQITSPHSTETSGYGIYDTSTIEKSVKAVVTLEYRVR